MEIISYEIIIVINTIFKNISINYLLFDSNTRRITLTTRMGKIIDSGLATKINLLLYNILTNII